MYRTTQGLRAALAIGLPALFAACSAEPVGLTNGRIDDFITTVTAPNGIDKGVLHEGDLPVGLDGPSAQVAGIGTVVNGGSASINLTGSGEFQRVYISMATATGYWELPLSTGTSVQDVILSVNNQVRPGNLRMRYTLEGANGVGAVAEQTIRVLGVGTGDVQVSVAWTGASDVDLHVIEPGGEEIYWDDKTAASGGRLDLDSNPACNIDNKNNENIVWPTGKAPTGEYQVLLHYYDDCNVAKSEWVVTVLVKDKPPMTFTGKFEGAGGSSSPAVEVTRFTY